MDHKDKVMTDLDFFTGFCLGLPVGAVVVVLILVVKFV
jgi:hypothetical protein